MEKGGERNLIDKNIEGFKSLSSRKSGTEPQFYFFSKVKI